MKRRRVLLAASIVGALGLAGLAGAIALAWRRSARPLVFECRGPVMAIAFGPRDALVAAAQWGGDGVIVRSLGDGTLVHSIPVGTSFSEECGPGIAFAPASETLAVAEESSGGRVQLCSPRDGTLIRTLAGGAPPAVAVQFLPAGDAVVTANALGAVRVWSIRDGALRFKINTADAWPQLACSHALIATAAAYAIRLWSARDGTHVRTILRTRPPRHVALSPEGDLLAWAEGSNAYIAPVTGDELPRELAGHIEKIQAMAFSPSGELLATAGDDGIVRIWSVRDGALVRTIEPLGGAVFAVGFSRAGDRLATGTFDRKLRIWPLR